VLALIKKLWTEEKGQGMTEYGLILALIVIVVIGVLAALGGDLKTKFEEVKGGLNQQQQ